MIIPLIIISVWLGLNLIVGLAAKRKEALNIEEYFVASEGFGVIILWFMLAAGWLSAFAFLGGPGWAFSRGAPSFYIIIYCASFPIMLYILLPKVRALGKKNSYFTQIDLIADRYRNNTIPLIMALVSYISMVPYVSLQMIGAGYIFRVASGGKVSFNIGALIAFGIVCLYVFTSGMRGVGWTTLIQGILMFGTAIISAIYIVRSQFGGLHQMFLAIEKIHPDALTLPGRGEPMPVTMFGTSVLLTVLGGCMWPHIFQRFYTAKSAKTAKLTAALTPFQGILNVAVTLVGLSGILLVTKIINADEVLIEVLRRYTPLWFLGLVCAGGMAAAMSTGSTIVHTLGSITGKDVYNRYVDPNASPRAVTNVTRFAVLVLGAVAYIFALKTPATLVYILLMAYGGISQFLPGIVGALFWPRANTKGVLLGLIVGVGVTGIFTFSSGPLRHPLGVHAGFWGLCLNFLVFIVVSFVAKPDPPEVVSRFFEEVSPAKKGIKIRYS